MSHRFLSLCDLTLFLMFSDEFIIGAAGGVTCPKGYSPVSHRNVCKGKVTSALKRTFFGEHCWNFKAIGCFVNTRGYHTSIFFNNRVSQNPNDPSYAPLCRKGMIMIYFCPFTITGCFLLRNSFVLRKRYTCFILFEKSI